MNKLIFWVIVIGFTFGILTLIANILVPFITAFIIAYTLKPLVDCKAVRHIVPRYITSSFILCIFISIFVIACTLLFPIIYQQTSILINKIPEYKHYIQSELAPIMLVKFQSIDPDIAYKIQDSIDNFLNIIFSMITGLFNHLWGYTVATINIFMLITIVPILLFYFLRDWPKLINSIKELMPMKSKNKILEILVRLITY